MALSVCAAFLCAPGNAHAEAFVAPALDNIVKTLIRFGALDMRYDDVVDLYGSIVACDIYTKLHENEFKWEEVRQVLRQDVTKNIGLFPTAYRYDAKMQFGKFDFRQNLYRFSHKTAQFAANLFRLTAHREDQCMKKEGLILPSSFRLVLETPIEMLGIPMSSENAQKLVERMDQNGNVDKIVYVRFNIQVIYVEPFLKTTVRTLEEEKDLFRKTGAFDTLSGSADIRLDGRLDSIEYYEDEARTKMFYKQVL